MKITSAWEDRLTWSNDLGGEELAEGAWVCTGCGRDAEGDGYVVWGNTS